MEFSRRNLLCGLGGLAAASLVSPCMAAEAAREEAKKGPERPAGRFEQVNGQFGWKPHKLDPEECQAIAYDGYWYKGYACGYGAFYSIIGVMGEKFGQPYNQFPFSMLEANKGGVSNWGTICGALYGAAAAFALFYPRKERNPMVNELFRWYEVTALPIYNPGEMAQGVKGNIPQNVSDSVLCHLSVSKWCFENKIEATSKERSERCGRLTADVAKKAIEILNAKIEQGKDFKSTFPMQKAVSYCGECHMTKGNEANWGKGIMNCTPCHSGGSAVSDKFKNHP